MFSVRFFYKRKKPFLLAVLLFLIISIHSQVSKNFGECDLIVSLQKLMGGRLSDKWAQEMIGADLLRAELENLPRFQKRNWIVLFDTSKRDHSVYVKNLISDTRLQSVLPALPKSVISVFNTRNSAGYRRAIRNIRRDHPSFVNNSMAWSYRMNSDTVRVYEAMKSLPVTSIIVTAAGNFYPEPLLEFKSQSSRKLGAIVVGNFSSKGFVSDTSQEGREVHILAPSGENISNLDAYGR